MRYKLQLRLGAVGNSEQVSGGGEGKRERDSSRLFLEGRQNLPSSNLSGLRVQNPRSWKISRVMDFPIHISPLDSVMKSLHAKVGEIGIVSSRVFFTAINLR